jgi:predicted acylesterase/phospholipase RssA
VLVFTNGYWASEPGTARRWLSGLREASLDHILFSVDAFHQAHVHLERIATDIEAGNMVVLDSGPLIPALMATSALPTLIAPVQHQERWLVDGGVLNHLLVDIVRQKGMDRVLGVNVRCNLALPLDEKNEQGPPFSPDRWLLGPQDGRLPFLIADTSLDMVTRVVNHTRLAFCPRSAP